MYNGRWAFQDVNENSKVYKKWYDGFFEDAPEETLLGEDSTGYLVSRRAPSRIVQAFPDVKLIFILRDPVERTYSHYWHRLRKGRTARTFEGEIQQVRGPIITRSLYAEQVERFLRHFSREALHFILFEEMISFPQQTIGQVCEFLGLKSSIQVDEIEVSQNPSPYPRFPNLLRLWNTILRSITRERRATGRVPTMHAASQNFLARVARSADARLRHLNLSEEADRPNMKSFTREFLERLFEMENRGLSELIGRDVSEYWPYMNS